jgi:hypothetical protein
MKAYVEDKLRAMASKEALKQYVDVRVLATAATTKRLEEELSGTRATINTLMKTVEELKSELDAEKTKRRALEDTVTQRFAAAARAFADFDQDLRVTTSINQ